MNAPTRQGGTGAARAELQRRLIDWRPDLTGTLLFVVDAGRVLLMRKLRGHGAGRINGPGGKLEPGETPIDAAQRETFEETGIRAHGARLAAVMRFLDTDTEDWLGYVFVADGFRGDPQATPEGIPQWYPLDALPFEEMWEDDRLWLPAVLAGERLRGDFLFHDGRLVAWELSALDPATACIP